MSVDEQQEIVVLEEALRAGLQHLPVPAGFTVRVKERVAQRSSRQQKQMLPGTAGMISRRHTAWWSAVAAMFALSAGADLLHIAHQRQAVEAQKQVDYAMQLTTHALDEVEIRVNRSPAGRFAQLQNEIER